MWKKKINRELQSHQCVLKEKARESQRIHRRSDSHCTDRFYTWFYRGCVISGILVEFPVVGSVLVIMGMIFFSMGAELSMTPMGEHVGGSMLRTKKVRLYYGIGFILGFVSTISEPDLQVLAERKVSSVPNLVLISSVALGVGRFLLWPCAYPFWNCAAAICYSVSIF